MRILLIFFYKFKIFKRIIPSIIKKVNFNKYIIINHNNFMLKLNLNNPIDMQIYLTKKYEEKNIFFLKKLIKENKINFFFDIGAHMGFYSMNIASRFPKIYIKSFEPIKSSFYQLKKNTELNKYNHQIDIHKKALSNKTKKIKMWVPIKTKTGGFSIYNKKDNELQKYDKNKISYESAISIKLDDIYKFKNKKIAVKIDVERHEKFVILGGEKFFTNNKILLQVELFDERKKEVDLMLKKMNFKFIKCNKKDNFYSNYKIKK
jgi:FkbM family methyltransferase